MEDKGLLIASLGLNACTLSFQGSLARKPTHVRVTIDTFSCRLRQRNEHDILSVVINIRESEHELA